MEKELYLECCRGLDCEMILSALLELGVSKREVEKQLAVFGKEKNQENISFIQAEEWIEKLHIETEIKKRLMKALEIIQAAEVYADLPSEKGNIIPMSVAENSFENLAALGIALEMLGFSEIKISPVTEGTGEGERLSPMPEILSVLEKYGLPVRFTENKGEMLTLNSVSFLAAFAVERQFPQRCYIEKTAFVEKKGRKEAGDEPKALRAMILSTKKESSLSEEKRDVVQVLETNVDDCSGEQLGYAIECLMKAGALDASCFPVYMKKHRPAYMLQVICKKEKQELLEDIIFRETTSIGLRRYEERRRILPRIFQEIRLKDGHRVKIKVCEHHGQKFYYPEYETIKQVCEQTGRPYRSVYDEAAALAGGLFDENL